MKQYSLIALGIFFILFLGGNFLFTFQIHKSNADQYKQYQEIPEHLRNTIVSIEDRRFFYHPGIDPIAITRVIHHNIPLIRNSQSVTPQGASTIDQQLIKLSQQAFQRTWTQKLKEQFLALNLQFHYSKQEIFVAYINSIPFSYGIVGRKQACDMYFQKSCNLLNDAELSYLLAVAQLGINPYKESNQEKILTRAKVLCNGESCPLLSSPHYIKLSYKETPLDPRVDLFLRKQVDAPSHPEKASVPLEGSDQGGLASDQPGTFNQSLYSSIQSILSSTKSLRQQYNAQDCCVIILNKNGDLISMNMCSNRADPEAGKINLCLEPRQTGSAIKPFLYLYAMISKGLKATDMIIDEPIQFNLGNGNIYEPKNFDLKHHGEVTLAYALGNSLNIPAIKLTQMVGVPEFLGFLKAQLSLYASGYDHNNKNPEDVGLSVGLGTYEISPYAFTKLRTLFLNDSVYRTLTQPQKQFSPPDKGDTAKPRGFGSPKQKQEIISILSNPNNKVASFGQDSFLNTPGRAVKTGTSRKFIDGRVCGVNPKQELSMCIWMGNYNNEAMKGASSEVGGYLWNVISKSIIE